MALGVKIWFEMNLDLKHYYRYRHHIRIRFYWSIVYFVIIFNLDNAIY